MHELVRPFVQEQILFDDEGGFANVSSVAAMSGSSS
jgi:hypothetical protein